MTDPATLAAAFDAAHPDAVYTVEPYFQSRWSLTGVDRNATTHATAADAFTAAAAGSPDGHLARVCAFGAMVAVFRNGTIRNHETPEYLAVFRDFYKR